MIYIFPRMTKCTFHKFGVSGEVEKHDALCILPLNIVNEKIYIFIWFWYIFAFASDLFKNRYQHSKQARSVSLWMRRLGTSTASRLGLGLCGCGDTDLAYLLCQYLFLNKPIPDSVFIFVLFKRHFTEEEKCFIQRIRTPIIRVEGEHADYQTTTPAQLQVVIVFLGRLSNHRDSSFRISPGFNQLMGQHKLATLGCSENPNIFSLVLKSPQLSFNQKSSIY